ncbi:head GIN domain-containing protein [Spirosoma rhododendri]|uniref:DUF2807 domain-containing protein n=1 Tax=Spirosoma rhododendri TaxID=2728024 RepID=A0A7L5DSS2_9BACT|nr:head GIN domain-containing protein [Spirosoma rhododendri]QJD81529.1 DUF2807 domain-containing protein [Spirosoma rhododendri]
MKNTRVLLLLSLLLFSAPLLAQRTSGGIVGSGKTIEETRTVASYDRLLVDFTIKVHIAEGAPGTVVLEGEDNVLPYVEIAVNSGELRIGLSRKAKFNDTKPVTVTIHRAALRSIQANTACTITADVPVVADQLTVSLNEASRLTADLDVQQLTVRLQAASSVTLRGKAQKADFQLDGASRVYAEQLRIAKADLTLNGASHATVDVTENLSASADGVSVITYSGSPVIDRQRAGGLSTIKHVP